jgi:hypothetical protein
MKKIPVEKHKHFKARYIGHCTSCGGKLPDTLLGWGLNWYDGTGMCAKCLYDIRLSIGYFEPAEAARRKERKNRGSTKS